MSCGPKDIPDIPAPNHAGNSSDSQSQVHLLRQLDGTVQQMHVWVQNMEVGLRGDIVALTTALGGEIRNIEAGLRRDIAVLTARVESLEIVARGTAQEAQETGARGRELA